MYQMMAQILLIAISLGGLFLVLLALPGTWLMVLAALAYGHFYPWDAGATSNFWVLTVLIALATLAELIEFVVGTIGGKYITEVSTGALVSAFVGGIIGAMIGVPIFIIGSIIGMLIGVFAGAWLYEWIKVRDVVQASLAAFAVLSSRIVATGLKFSIALCMLVYLAFKIN